MSFAVILFILAAISSTFSFYVCPKDHCEQVKCVEVTNCSGSNQAVKRGGFCSCCDMCYTILG